MWLLIWYKLQGGPVIQRAGLIVKFVIFAEKLVKVILLFHFLELKILVAMMVPSLIGYAVAAVMPRDTIEAVVLIFVLIVLLAFLA